MLCFDTNLLGDYLDGVDAAKAFLEEYEGDPWAIPSLVLFEAAGTELESVDALLVASADEHGATFATNDGTLLEPAVRERLDVVEYPR